MSDNNTRPIAKTVNPIHFEDYSGTQFERLVFAYHARTECWESLEWYGQQGKDSGRDILGVKIRDDRPAGELRGILCANWQKLTYKKIQTDIGKIIKSKSGKPESLRIVCGHNVPAGLRDKAKDYAAANGVYQCEVWSGSELEERIRANAESLIARFVNGEEFPDVNNDLLLFAWGSVPLNDQECVSLISRAFDRPAFTTPIHMESSLPAFHQAIEDTIRVLNTGVWQTRERQVIRRLPTKHDIVDGEIKRLLDQMKSGLANLRFVFDDLRRANHIRGCDEASVYSSFFTMDDHAVMELTKARAAVIRDLDLAKDISSNARTRQTTEDDDDQFLLFCAKQEEISGSIVFCPACNTDGHRWAERMVERGKLSRDDHGAYMINSKSARRASENGGFLGEGSFLDGGS